MGKIGQGLSHQQLVPKVPRYKDNSSILHFFGPCTFADESLGLENRPRKKVFRFEEMWLSNNLCGEIVEASWLKGGILGSSNDVLMKVDKCSKELTWWNKNCFENVRKVWKRSSLSRQLNMKPQGVVVIIWLENLKLR